MCFAAWCDKIRCAPQIVTVMCRTFAAKQVVATLAVTLVTLIWLLFQLNSQPYQHQWVNQLQSCACVCLLVLCTLQLVMSTFNSAVFNPDESPLADFGHNVRPINMRKKKHLLFCVLTIRSCCI